MAENPQSGTVNFWADVDYRYTTDENTNPQDLHDFIENNF